MESDLACIDIGANLTHKSFNKDIDRVLSHAWDAGLQAMVLTGASTRGSVEASGLCAKSPERLFSTAGVHPHEAKSVDQNTIPQLRELASHPHVVAVGECGLDYNRDFSPRDQQRSALEQQLALAVELQLPVFMHERDAHEDFVAILKPFRDQLPAAVVHCFTGDVVTARAYLDLDLHLGITGWICDERRGQHLRDIVKDIPDNRMMIETDAPYLAPRDIRPKVHRNEPKFLPHILRTIADCRGEQPATLAADVLETTKRFFQLKL